MTVTIEKQQSPTWTVEFRDLLAPYPERFNLRCSDESLGKPLPATFSVFRINRDAVFSGMAWWDAGDDQRAELEMCLNSCGQGIGSDALELLIVEARKQGLLRFRAVVRGTNPDRAKVIRWLQRNLFEIELPEGWKMEDALGNRIDLEANGVLFASPGEVH